MHEVFEQTASLLSRLWGALSAEASWLALALALLAAAGLSLHVPLRCAGQWWLATLALASAGVVGPSASAG